MQKKSKTELAQSVTEAINKQNNTGGQKNAKEKKKEWDRDESRQGEQLK